MTDTTVPVDETEPESRMLERAVSVVLRVGIVLSSAAIAAGTVVTLASSSTRRAAARSLPGLRHGTLHPSGLEPYKTVSGVLHGLSHSPGPALVMVGVLLLVATPVMRVAASVLIFAIERDRRYVVITALVLAVLLASFTIG